MAQPDGSDEREALRRRLYQPDASESDLARFASVEPPSAGPPAAGPPAPAAPSRRGHRRLAVAASSGVLVAALVVLVATTSPTRTPAPSASPTGPPVVGAIAGTEVRAELVAVEAGAPRATTISTSLGGVPTRLQRFHGSGGSVVEIDTRGAPRSTGTLLVMVTASSGTGVGWLATRPATRSGHAAFAEIVARGTSDPAGEGPPAYSMCAYDGPPPSRLAIEDPGPGTWTLSVAFLPRRSSEY